MTERERPQSDPIPDFTEREQLFSRVSTERLRAFFDHETTIIHRANVDMNSYGEFLFITLSLTGDPKRTVLTFFGLGLHEHRERWLVDEWFWHRSNPSEKTLAEQIERAVAEDILRERQAEIAAAATDQTQSKRGQLFDLLADLSDDDGALADFDDFNRWLADDEG
jgi:hypothetical protein